MTTCVRTTLDTRPAKPPGPVARLGTSFLEILQILGESALMLVHDPALYDEAEEAIASLHQTADTIADISANLRQGEGTLGKMLTDDSLYREAQDAVRTVQRATQGVEDQAPISVLSTLASSLF